MIKADLIIAKMYSNIKLQSIVSSWILPMELYWRLMPFNGKGLDPLLWDNILQISKLGMLLVLFPVYCK